MAPKLRSGVRLASVIEPVEHRPTQTRPRPSETPEGIAVTQSNSNRNVLPEISTRSQLPPPPAVLPVPVDAVQQLVQILAQHNEAERSRNHRTSELEAEVAFYYFRSEVTTSCRFPRYIGTTKVWTASNSSKKASLSSFPPLRRGRGNTHLLLRPHHQSDFPGVERFPQDKNTSLGGSSDASETDLIVLQFG